MTFRDICLPSKLILSRLLVKSLIYFCIYFVTCIYILNFMWNRNKKTCYLWETLCGNRDTKSIQLILNLWYFRSMFLPVHLWCTKIVSLLELLVHQRNWWSCGWWSEPKEMSDASAALLIESYYLCLYSFYFILTL